MTTKYRKARKIIAQLESEVAELRRSAEVAVHHESQERRGSKEPSIGCDVGKMEPGPVQGNDAPSTTVGRALHVAALLGALAWVPLLRDPETQLPHKMSLVVGVPLAFAYLWGLGSGSPVQERVTSSLVLGGGLMALSGFATCARLLKALS